MFHLIWTFLVGVFVGFIAKHLMGFHLGFFMTGLLGVAGSYAGGLIARLFSKPKDGSFVHPAGILMSIVGAVLLLYAYEHLAR